MAMSTLENLNTHCDQKRQGNQHRDKRPDVQHAAFCPHRCIALDAGLAPLRQRAAARKSLIASGCDSRERGSNRGLVVATIMQGDHRPVLRKVNDGLLNIGHAGKYTLNPLRTGGTGHPRDIDRNARRCHCLVMEL